MTAFCFIFATFILGSAAATAQTDSKQQAQSEDLEQRSGYELLMTEAKPAVWWRFDKANLAEIQSGMVSGLHVKTVGKIVSQPGPTSPTYRNFSNSNLGAKFDGKSYLKITDPGEESVFDFKNGDQITVEAWVNPTVLNEGQQVYIIGKGRTGNKGFPKENQNWSLRIRGMGGTARISVLFRDVKNRNDRDYHRWNSKSGFVLDGNWHHIAFSYEFGNPKSTSGFVDGRKVDGTWGMGGETTVSPIVDNDEVWIGSSMAGNPGSSFVGAIDELALFRRIVPAKELINRYNAKLLDPYQKFVKDTQIQPGTIECEVLEQIPVGQVWNQSGAKLMARFQHDSMAFNRLPNKYTSQAVIDHRPNPILFRVRAKQSFPKGKHKVLLRAKSATRLFLDNELVMTTKMMAQNADGHDPVPDLIAPLYSKMHPAPAGHQEEVAEIEFSGKPQTIRLETIVGGKNLRSELGELVVAIQSESIAKATQTVSESKFYVITAGDRAPFELNQRNWKQFEDREFRFVQSLNAKLRQQRDQYKSYWKKRHEIAKSVTKSRLNAIKIPASQKGYESFNNIDRFINQRLKEKNLAQSPLVGDSSFIRRIALDTVGVIPSRDEIESYRNDNSTNRRSEMIERYLNDDRWADNWVGYWQDVLAENPGILKPKLNNTGPFRFWIYESFLDNKPMDRFVTELVMMRGGRFSGGPAGFSIATQNDVPMAAKAHTLAKAFLAMEMKCARCHDAPNHDFKQEQLFNLAALLDRKPIKLPKSSTVIVPKGARQPFVQISLKAGEVIQPNWPFAHGKSDLPIVRNPKDSREKFAISITSPTNVRFAKVMVNRLWDRYFGRGLVNYVDDWPMDSSKIRSSHTDLLEYLAHELIANGYNLKHIASMIFNSRTYQQTISEKFDSALSKNFGTQNRRKLSAEQVVDSLYSAVGKRFHGEQLTLDPEGRRDSNTFLNFGAPRRAWEFTSLSNERDRPALALPMAQSVVDLLIAFGWRDSRPSPITNRSNESHLLQPLIVSNGNAGHRLAQFSDNGEMTRLAISAKSADEFVDQMFQQVLSRTPSSAEKEVFVNLLDEGFEKRLVPGAGLIENAKVRNAVSWSNHLHIKATEIKLELEVLAQKGDKPTRRLESQWRLRAEDALWALLNSPEFVFIP